MTADLTSLAERLEGAIPNPGSDEALARGCTCPVLDNAHGKGYMGVPGTFVIREECPLHGEDFDRDTPALANKETHRG